MPDYVPGFSTGAPPPAWMGAFRQAVRAMDPRRVWDFYVQLGYVVVDAGIRASAWATDELNDLARTAIKAVRQARGDLRALRRDLDALPPSARAEFEATWRGRATPLFDKLVSWSLKLAEVMASSAGKLAGGTTGLLHSLRGELQGMQAEGVGLVFSGVRWGIAPVAAPAAAGGVAATVGLSAGTVVALSLASIAALAFAVHFAIGEVRGAIQDHRRDSFLQSLPPEVRGNPSALADAMAAYERDREQSPGTTWGKGLEALGKALPWVAAAGIAGAGVKVWLDWRRGARLEQVDEMLARPSTAS